MPPLPFKSRDSSFGKRVQCRNNCGALVRCDHPNVCVPNDHACDACLERERQKRLTHDSILRGEVPP